MLATIQLARKLKPCNAWSHKKILFDSCQSKNVISIFLKVIKKIWQDQGSCNTCPVSTVHCAPFTSQSFFFFNTQ